VRSAPFIINTLKGELLMIKKTRLMFILFVALALIAAGCSSDTPSDTEPSSDPGDNDQAAEQPTDEPKLLILNNGGEPTSLDPPIGNDERSYSILNNVMEGLTRLAKDSPVPEPAMAEDWDISNDGLTYTFYIRQNAYWTNGDPVTAHDFEYAFKRLANPETASPAAHHSYWIAGAEAFNTGEGSEEDMLVTAVDDKTLRVTLEYPVDFFLSIVAMPQLFPVHKETVENNPNWANSVDTLVTNGPFKVTEWRHDEEILIEKNENYWDAGKVNLDAVLFLMIEDSNTAYQLYQNDELHFTSSIPSDLIEQLLDSGETIIFPRSGIEFQRFNVTQEPFQNKNIRKAFAMAINAQDIVDYVIKGGQTVMNGYVYNEFAHPLGGTWRDQVGSLHEFNPEEARRLLELGMQEEGYTELPTVTLSYNTSDQHHDVAQVVQQMLKENLGVEIELFNQEWAVFLDAQRNLELQYSRSSFLGGYNDPINYLDNFTTGNPMNRTGWSNEEYDQLVRESYQTIDAVERFELMQKAEEVFMEEAVIVPLYFYNTIFLSKDYVSDIVRHPVGFIELKWADMR
jgi:dipeptide transport system substrate-binding protein